MDFGIRNRRALAQLWGGALALTLLTAEATADEPMSAVWVSKQLVFQYQGFTTRYTCDGLQAKMKRLLIELGAREDLRVSPYGCTHLTAPDLFAGVQIRMNVLQAAPVGAVQSVPVRWQSVDLLARRDPLDAAADCELISQLKQRVLPLFTTRDLEFTAQCANRQVVIGSTRLKLDVLVPAGAVPLASAAH
jgi:hypothetical protein